MDTTFFRKKVIIGCFIVLVTLLSGCSMQKSNQEYFQNYGSRKLDISELGDGLINLLDVQEGDIYFSFFSEVDKSITLYRMDADELQPERIPLENEIKGAQLWDGACPADDKRYIVSFSQEGLRLNELNEKNELVTQIDLEAVIPDYFSNQYTFKTDKNGLLYFTGMGKVYVLDEHGTLLLFQTYEGEWIHGYKDNENEVHIVRSAKNADYMYDVSQNKLVKTGKHKTPDFSSVESIFDGSGEFSFYYIQESDKTGRAIYGVKDNTSYLLCNLSDTGIAINSMTKFYALGKDQFLFKVQINGIDDFVLLEPCDQADGASKQTITLAGIQIPDEINDAANRFNLEHQDVQINVVDYMYLYHHNFEDAYKNLNLNLLDKQIDLLCLNHYNKRNLISKSMLEDLKTFLDDSERIKRSEFLDCIVDNWTMEDGKIYSLFPQFQIRTFIKSGQGEAQSVYDMLNDHATDENQKLFLNSDAEALLYSLIKYNPEQLMNYEDNTCTFDGAYFEKVLTILEDMDSYTLKSNDIAEAVRNNKIKYFQMPINDIFDYILYLQMCDYEVEFIGYPTEEGLHPIMQSTSELGILAASDQKEYAWRFLEYMLEEQQYDDLFGGEAFPVRNDSMEDLLERMSATETYTKEDGTVIRAVDQYSIGINDYDIVPKALREEDIAKFKDMLDRSVVCDGLSEEQIDVIWEEVQSFLAGSQDKETTIRNIQSRISVTVQE